MSAVWSVVLMLCLAVCAEAQSRTLAVAAGVPPGMDAASTQDLQLELQHLLNPASIEVTWLGAGSGKAPADYELMVVGSFTGTCSVDALPAFSGSPLASKTLGDAAVLRDRVLPYFQVDCGLLVRTLSPSLAPLSVPMRRAVLGRAMARVIAHEIYHVVAQTTEHDDSGVAKASFSLHDLVSQHIEFNLTSIARMRPELPSTLPSIPAAARAQVNAPRRDPSLRSSGAVPQPEQSLLRVRASDGAVSGSRSSSANMLLPR